MNFYFKLSSRVVSVALFMLAIPLMAFADGNQSSDQPTMVLVHGAWAGPSSWDGVVRRLNDAGFRTVTPALGLSSLPGDVATVDAVLNQIPGKKVLGGHSYGVAVISAASSGPSPPPPPLSSPPSLPHAGATP